MQLSFIIKNQDAQPDGDIQRTRLSLSLWFHVKTQTEAQTITIADCWALACEYFRFQS